MKGGTGFVRFSRASTETTRSDGGAEVREDLLGRPVGGEAGIGPVELQLLAAPGDSPRREEGLPLRQLERHGEVGTGRKRSLSASRSTMIRSATVWTRPPRAPPDLLPEEVGDLVADEPVDDAARLLRGDAVRVDLAGARDRLLDGALRDLVELGAVEARLGRRGPQQLLEVPADRLPLAVGVGGEEDLVGGLRVLLQVGDRLLLAGKDLVRRLVAASRSTEIPFRGRSRTCP